MVAADEEDIVAFLRGNGLQVTHQRLAIYTALLNSTTHPTAEEIYREVAKKFPLISLGTVYKNLERFLEKGVVQRISPFSDAMRYEISAKPHHHVVCVKCCTIKDIFDTVVESGLTLPDGHGFKVLERSVIVRGYCPDCIE